MKESNEFFECFSGALELARALNASSRRLWKIKSNLRSWSKENINILIFLCDGFTLIITMLSFASRHISSFELLSASNNSLIGNFFPTKTQNFCHWYFRYFQISVFFMNFLFPFPRFRFTSWGFRYVHMHSIFRDWRDVLVGFAHGEWIRGEVGGIKFAIKISAQQNPFNMHEIYGDFIPKLQPFCHSSIERN